MNLFSNSQRFLHWSIHADENYKQMAKMINGTNTVIYGTEVNYLWCVRYSGSSLLSEIPRSCHKDPKLANGVLNIPSSWKGKCCD